MKRAQAVVWIVGALAFVVLMLLTKRHVHRRNVACHHLCVSKGYAAGEFELLYEHDVCACFRLEPAPPAYVVRRIADL
jgi:hypothetical protein